MGNETEIKQWQRAIAMKADDNAKRKAADGIGRLVDADFMERIERMRAIARASKGGRAAQKNGNSVEAIREMREERDAYLYGANSENRE